MSLARDKPSKPGFAVRSRLSKGEALGAVWLSLGSVAIAELAGRAGADIIILDLQHGLWERRDVEAAVGLASLTTPVMIRVAENSAFAIGSALDAGAAGLLVPMVETATQAQAAVAAARFPPHGNRSGGGVRPLSMGFANYLEQAAGIAVGVMIETVAGVKAARDIAAVPGLDFILIGTGDLSLSYAGVGQTGGVADACQTVRRACVDAGIACGMFTTSIDAARRAREDGFVLVVVANDIDLVNSGFAAAAEQFRAPA